MSSQPSGEAGRGGGTKCTCCGSNEFEVVDCQRACTSCGTMISDSALVADFSASCGPSSTEFRSYSRSLPSKYAAMNDTSRPQFPAGKRRLKEVCSVLRFTDEMTEAAKDLLDRIARHPRILNMTIENKLHAVVACTYIVCLQRRWPMSLEHIASISGYPANNIIRFKKFIISELELKVVYLGITDTIEPMINEKGLDKACCNLAEDIVFVCIDTWLTHGRNPIPVVSAAVFLAWKSVSFVDRYKTKFSIFAKQHNVKSSCTVNSRVKEMIDLFIRLAKQLPWVNPSMKLDRNTVIEYIPDVCRYKKATMVKALAATETKSEDDYSGATDTREDAAGTNCIKTEKSFGSTATKRTVCDDFCPPSFKRARKRSLTEDTKSSTGHVDCVNYNGDLDAEELGESDIPDSQMDQYIRSDKEVQAVKNIMPENCH